jgi:hypothetical protein
MRIRTAKRTTRVTPVLRSRKPSIEEKGRSLISRLKVSFIVGAHVKETRRCEGRCKRSGKDESIGHGVYTATASGIAGWRNGTARSARGKRSFSRSFNIIGISRRVCTAPRLTLLKALPVNNTHNLSYGQLFLKPLFHLNSVPLSIKQR